MPAHPDPESVVASKPCHKTPYQIHVFQQSDNGDQPSESSELQSAISHFPQSSSFISSTSGTLRLPHCLKPIDAWPDTLFNSSPNVHLLLGHYQNITSLTLANDSPARLTWKTSILELATRHPYVLYSVLSVASLHLGRLYDDPVQRSEMNTRAVDQMNRALKYYQPAIGKVNKENAASLFATSTLTAVFVFRMTTADMETTLASLPKGGVHIPTETSNHLVRSITQTLQCLRGALSALYPVWKWVVESELRALCTREWWPTNPLPANDRAMQEDTRLGQLEGLWMLPGRDYEDHSRHLTQALHFLRHTYALVSQLTTSHADPSHADGVPYSTDCTTVGFLKDRAAIIAWASIIPREFISLIERRDRDAMVIIAHWAILIGRIRSVWWLDGLGPNVIMSIAMIIGKENWYLLKWPAEAVGIDLEERFG